MDTNVRSQKLPGGPAHERKIKIYCVNADHEGVYECHVRLDELKVLHNNTYAYVYDGHFVLCSNFQGECSTFVGHWS